MMELITIGGGIIMYEVNQRRKFNWPSFIIGILFVIFAIISFIHPDRSLHLLSVLVGIGSIIKGIYELWFNRFLAQLRNTGSGWLIAMGIIDIILGLVFVFYRGFGAIVIATIFAVWFIFESASGMVVSPLVATVMPGIGFLNIFFGVIMVVLGVIMLFSPMLSALTLVWLISAYLLMLGIVLIVHSFSTPLR